MPAKMSVMDALEDMLDAEAGCGHKRKREEAEVEQEMCVVCQDEVEMPCGVIGCGHKFCYPCISEWAKRSNRCPVCKRRFMRLKKISAKGKILINRKIRNKTFSDYNQDIDSDDYLSGSDEGTCITCGAGDESDKLLCCDYPGCDNVQHCYCTIPSLDEPPADGDFFCSECTEAHSLPAQYTALDPTIIIPEDSLDSCSAAPLPPQVDRIDADVDTVAVSEPRPIQVANPGGERGPRAPQRTRQRQRRAAAEPDLLSDLDELIDSMGSQSGSQSAAPAGRGGRRQNRRQNQSDQSGESEAAPTQERELPKVDTGVNPVPLKFEPPLIPEVIGPIIRPPPPMNPNAQDGLMHLIKPTNTRTVSVAKLNPHPANTHRSVAELQQAFAQRLVGPKWPQPPKPKDVPQPLPASVPRRSMRQVFDLEDSLESSTGSQSQPLSQTLPMLSQLSASDYSGSTVAKIPVVKVRKGAPVEHQHQHQHHMHQRDKEKDAPTAEESRGMDQMLRDLRVVMREKKQKRVQRPLSQIYAARAAIVVALLAGAKGVVVSRVKRPSLVVSGVPICDSAKAAVNRVIKKCLVPAYTNKLLTKSELKAEATAILSIFLASAVVRHRSKIADDPSRLTPLISTVQEIAIIRRLCDTTVDKYLSPR